MITMLHVTSHSSVEKDPDVRLTAEIPANATESMIWVEIADDDHIRGAVQLDRLELLAWAKEVVRLTGKGATP